jgi:RNA polymerase sigma factor (sigma-70 family)
MNKEIEILNHWWRWQKWTKSNKSKPTKIYSKTSKYFYFTLNETTDLVEQAKNGDQKAITKLFNKYKPILYNIIKNSTVNLSKEEYEDEVLTFLGRIFSKDIHKFDESKSNFNSWMTFCFKRHIISIPKRKKQIHTNSIEDLSTTDDGNMEYNIKSNFDFETFVETPSFISIARLLLTNLPKKQASILVDKYWYDLHDREIEAKHNLPYKTAWAQTKKAIRNLLKKVNKNDYI